MPDSPAARQVAAFHRLAALTETEIAAATDAGTTEAVGVAFDRAWTGRHVPCS